MQYKDDEHKSEKNVNFDFNVNSFDFKLNFFGSK